MLNLSCLAPVSCSYLWPAFICSSSIRILFPDDSRWFAVCCGGAGAGKEPTAGAFDLPASELAKLVPDSPLGRVMSSSSRHATDFPAAPQCLHVRLTFGIVKFEWILKYKLCSHEIWLLVLHITETQKQNLINLLCSVFCKKSILHENIFSNVTVFTCSFKKVHEGIQWCYFKFS